MPMPVSVTRRVTRTWSSSRLSALDFEQHLALLGELHGVGQQVGEDLPQTHGIAHGSRWAALADVADQVESFAVASAATMASQPSISSRRSNAACSSRNSPESILE